jgi:transposase
MEKIDARKLTPRELSEKRKIAISLREKGMPNKEVAKIVGISAQTISTYYTRYKKEGKKVFKVKSAGRPKNVGKTLSDEQEQKIIRQLIDFARVCKIL